MIDPSLVQWIVPVATVAAAWGGVSKGLNGTRERVKSIESKLDAHIADETTQYTKVVERLAVVETKIDSSRRNTGEDNG